MKRSSILTIGLLVAIAALTILTSGCGRQYMSDQGVLLDNPSESRTTKVFENRWPYPIGVCKQSDWPNRDKVTTIPSGKTYRLTVKSEEDANIMVIAFDSHGLFGERKVERVAPYNLLYQGPNIVIDEKFVYGLFTTTLVVTNWSLDSVDCNDNHGYRFTLGPGEFVELEVVIGRKYHVSWWPTDRSLLKSWHKKPLEWETPPVPREKTKMINGKLHSWGVHIDQAVWG